MIVFSWIFFYQPISRFQFPDIAPGDVDFLFGFSRLSLVKPHLELRIFDEKNRGWRFGGSKYHLRRCSPGCLGPCSSISLYWLVKIPGS